MSELERKAPVPGERFVHFKNKHYQIVAVAIHSETREKMVIYQALYDDFGVYARPYDMFMSEVDHVKYPNVKQKWRFSRLDEYVSDDVAVAANSVAADKVVVTDKGPVAENESRLDEPVKEEPVMKEMDDMTEEGQVPQILLDFLDAETAKEKLELVKYKARELDDQLIDSLAASLDVVIDDGPIAKRIDELKACLITKMKYELERFR